MSVLLSQPPGGKAGRKSSPENYTPKTSEQKCSSCRRPTTLKNRERSHKHSGWCNGGTKPLPHRENAKVNLTFSISYVNALEKKCPDHSMTATGRSWISPGN